MSFMSNAGRLPVEVVSTIVDWLNIQHIMVLSHVCARWRAVARAHPTFWRDIRLAAVSDAALEFFRARLDSPAARRVCICVRLADYPLCEGIEKVVIPAVTRNLGRVVQLSLDMHSTTAPHLFSGLLEPAPLLEDLELRFFHHRKGQPVAILPANLFAGVCPRLEDLSLTSVMFPPERIPAFHRVHSLLYHFRRRRVFPLGLFDQFPALENFTIMGNSHLRVQSAEEAVTTLKVPPLNELELWLAPWAYDSILSSFADLASVRHIVCRRPGESVAQQLIDHLRGPLELSLLCLADNMTHIILHEPTFARMRTIIESEQSVLDDLPRSVIFTPSLTERFQTLRLCAQLAYLAPHIEELSQCRVLELILNSKWQHSSSLDISAPLRLPYLCAIVVGTGEEHPAPTRSLTVDAGPLHKLLSQLLGALPKRPSLKLHGVSVSGDSEELFRAFELTD